jgi:UDP-glucose 4-epimerase
VTGEKKDMIASLVWIKLYPPTNPYGKTKVLINHALSILCEKNKTKQNLKT